jgi:hypothetical protein
MAALVSVTQAMDALRYDDADNEPVIQFAIESASAVVLRHLKLDDDAFADSHGEIPTDSSGDVIGVPADIQRAVIYLVGMFLRDPAGIEGFGDAKFDFDQYILPRPVQALLMPWRKPTYA